VFVVKTTLELVGRLLSSVNTLISLTRLSTNYELAIEAKRSRNQLIGESFVCVSPAGDLAT
jgi:hypothetical protein